MEKNKRALTTQQQIAQLDMVQHRDMAEWQFRRVRYPFKAPLLFDCRFIGAAEQIVQARWQKFLNQFIEVNAGILADGKINCRLEDISPRILELISKAEKSGYDPLAIAVEMKMERNVLADAVSEETGRNATGDEIRHMGIGDQIVLIGILQSVEKQLGPGSVTVIYDPLYTCSGELFSLSGLRCIPADPGDDITSYCDADTSLIDMQRHFLEHPLCDNVPCYYGEDGGDPALQALWNMGWEHCLPDHLIGHPKLHVRRSVMNDIQKYIPVNSKFVVCQPLECTRRNKYSSPAVYSAVLQIDGTKEIVFGCSKADLQKLESFIEEMRLPEHYHTHVVTEGIEKWCGIISKASRMITGNSSGMWLGFSTGVPMTVLSRADNSHGTMWNVRYNWFEDGREQDIIIIE